MATVKIVPAEDWEIVSQYLGNPAIILVPEPALSHFDEKDAALLRKVAENNEDMYDYDFGGEAEIFLDIIHCPESYAADKVLEYFAEEEE